MSNRIVGSSLPSTKDLAALEDSEAWLSLTEEGLEDILRSKTSNAFDDDDEEFSDDDDELHDRGEMEGVKDAQGNDVDSKADKKAQRMARQLERMAGKVEEFVEGKGALEGAEFSE